MSDKIELGMTVLARKLQNKENITMTILNTQCQEPLKFVFDYDHYNCLNFWFGECKRNLYHFVLTDEDNNIIGSDETL